MPKLMIIPNQYDSTEQYLHKSRDQQKAEHHCNLCKSDQFKPIFAIGDIPILECLECQHQFAGILPSREHVKNVYNDDYFFAGGAGYDNYLRESKLLEERGIRFEKLVRQFKQPGSMLEIGAAAGFGLKAFFDRGWSVTGIDPNHTMVKYGRENLHLNLHVASFEDWEPTQQVDLVVMAQVLPHLFEPREGITRIAEWLAPGGMLLLETWRRDSWTAKLTGKGWHEYNPPSVLHWFTLNELQQLGKFAGMEMVDYGHPKKYISGAHMKSLLAHQAERFPLSKLLKFGIQFIPSKAKFRYPAEDLVWAIYQKPL